ncbi:phosphatidylglycerophosphatase [Acinetobacter sp. NCu2D-2]|uniref:phosphatase PAP2 family protein n=1 Tax=Acinetobacter sp. NCu2D-2 TaxID=1608473 RepID=UPI0007CDE5A0|nr:phosphatase PAP2 family protein [Acinetobacter sp. NCu2D-2]ANF82293.1 phosphatidylglycerophosphatase [Acinetobacter sp. NCu2D-2]
MPYLLLGVGFLLFIISLLMLFFTPFQHIDMMSVEWMSLHRTSVFNQFTKTLSALGGMPFVLLFTTLWSIYLVWYKKYANIIFICIGIFGGISLSWLLKFVFSRPRPAEQFHLVESFGSSFPSAHSAYAACFAALMFLIFQQHKWRNLIFVCALMWLLIMGISRVYLGVHFPSDVISGWSISFIWISALYLLMAKHRLMHK